MPTRGASTSMSSTRASISASFTVSTAGSVAEREPARGGRARSCGAGLRHAQRDVAPQLLAVEVITSVPAYAAARAEAKVRAERGDVRARPRPPAVTMSRRQVASPAWSIGGAGARRRSRPRMTSPAEALVGQPEASTTQMAGGDPRQARSGKAARLGGGLERAEQVAAQAREHGLGLGVAEAHVELEHARARRRRASARRRARPWNGVPRRAQLVDGPAGGRRRRGRSTSCASISRPARTRPCRRCSGPVSPSPMRLKSRAGASGSHARRRKGEQRDLVAGEALLDHDGWAPKRRWTEHRLERGHCLGLVGGDRRRPCPPPSPSALITTAG